MTVEAMPLVAENTMVAVSAVHGTLSAPIRPPGPYVDDGFAVEVDRQRPTAVSAPREHAGEAAHRAGKVWIGCAVNTARQH